MIFYLFLEGNLGLAKKSEAEKRNRPEPKTNRGGKRALTLDEEVAKTEPEVGVTEEEPRKILSRRETSEKEGETVKGTSEEAITFSVTVEVGEDSVVGPEVGVGVEVGEGKLITREIGSVQSAEESAELV